LRRPPCTPQFQTARKLAVSFLSVTGLSGRPRYFLWAPVDVPLEVVPRQALDGEGLAQRGGEVP